MTFRATNAITSDAYLQLKRAANTLKLTADNYIVQVGSSDTDYGRLEEIYLTMNNFAVNTLPISQTAGLQTYAQDQEDDPGYDFQGEFTAMHDAAAACANWISQGIPISDRTLKPIEQWNGASTIVADAFTPTQMSGLVDKLQDVTDTIS